MEFEQLRIEAEHKGFRLELQTWIPDDYGENGLIITSPVSAWKITFPSDYPHPPYWITDAKGLQSAIDEYDNRMQAIEENIRISQQTRKSISQLQETLRR